MGLYKAGTIAISTAGAATGTGTAWTTAGTGIRTGQTILVNTNPAQQFTIQTINSATSLTLSPVPAAAIPAGTTYAILTTDALSVDGLGSQVAEAITYFKTSLGGRAASGANSDITSLGGLTTPLSQAQGGTGKNIANTPISVSEGGTGANSATAARTNLGLGTSAPLDVVTGNLDTTAGRLLNVGYVGIGGDIGNLGGVGLENASYPARQTSFGWSSGDYIPSLSMTGNFVTLHMQRGGRPCRISMTYDTRRVIYSFYTSTWTYVEAYHTGNTTKASNGVLSAASPVARIVQSKSACTRPDIAEDSFEWCGAGVANEEARGITITRVDVGVYTVAGSLGFAEDSWHLKAPADPAGNGDLAIVEGEQAEDGTLTIKLFKKRYKLNEETGDIDLIAGASMDVPANSWIDVRMLMPPVAVDGVISEEETDS
ncbi:phage tail protein [Rahnella victoriana]|uniref:Phage tail protein n=1 Tax=Rahnella victoriana TaxID=1510570 RepID=A0ABS0DL00_9GAMM|nr:phage tail protein [Rahnella victoriana]MBF7954581.1 phage tail protein [Rahnella victoriana]